MIRAVAWACAAGLLAAACGSAGGAGDAGADDAASDYADVAHEGALGDCGPDAGPPAGFHVTVDGTPAGDGSLAAPWDLATALAQPAAVRPGDTIWLHGGVYRGAFSSSLAGSDGAPITVRTWPGDWATIDGGPSDEITLVLQGEWAIYRDFEVTNSREARGGGRPEGMHVLGPQLKLINLLLHDLGNCGYWTPAVDLELYGCLIYNNGYDDSDRAHGHGVYTQNLEGTKHIEDNVIFNGYSYGIHAYTEGGAIQGFEIAGNVWFMTGVAAAGTDTLKDNCLVGGLQPAARIVLRENMGWAPSPDERSVRLGYDYEPNEDVALTGNYFVGETNFARAWNSIAMTGNTFYGPLQNIDPAAYPDNIYVAERPAEARVFVRPNRYETGRAHVVVYNWALADAVDVDLSGVLTVGATFEVRNAQNWFAGPVAGGTYDGSPVALPMTGLSPAQPIGSPAAIDPSETTGREFNVFVVRQDPGSCSAVDPDADGGP
jgi:hypothetical protein